MKRIWPIAWRMSLRIVGWWWGLISAALIAGLLLIWRDSWQAIEFVLPLIAALQAAFLFAPDDEPALELLLTAPRPLWWLIGERLLVLTLIQGTVGVISAVMLLHVHAALSVTSVVLGWLTPTTMLVGLALYLTLALRRSNFSILVVLLVYAGTRFGGIELLARWPFLWVAAPFLPPQWGTPDEYLLNRVVVTLIGLLLGGLALRLTTLEENLLISSKAGA